MSADGWIGSALRRREDPPLLKGQGGIKVMQLRALRAAARTGDAG